MSTLFWGLPLTPQLFVCHELTRVDIFVRDDSPSCEREDATLVATTDIEEYAMCAELRGNAARLAGESFWRAHQRTDLPCAIARAS